MKGNILFDYLKATFTLPELLKNVSFGDVIYPSTIYPKDLYPNDICENDCIFYIKLLEILGFDEKYIKKN